MWGKYKTLDVHVKRIRQKIEEDPHNPSHLVTVRGLGYKYLDCCSGRTGHTEAVRVVYDPKKVSYADLVATFYEVHDPTQGMRQGNDTGTQYRSAIYWSTPEQEMVARRVTEKYQPELTKRGYGPITTEIKPASETPYYYAEDHHQQYLVDDTGYRCHSAARSIRPRTDTILEQRLVQGSVRVITRADSRSGRSRATAP